MVGHLHLSPGHLSSSALPFALMGCLVLWAVTAVASSPALVGVHLHGLYTDSESSKFISWLAAMRLEVALLRT